MTPLRTLDLAGFPLRIYASPLDMPDHPWASFEDLMDMADMDDVERVRWLDKLRHELSDMVHEMPDKTVIVAEPVVGGLFLAWQMMGCEQAQEVLDDWTDAWMDVFARQLAQLPQDEWMQVARAAELRNTPQVPGVTVLQ